jgi:hypothetical protein
MNMPDPKAVWYAIGLHRELHTLILLGSFHRFGLCLAIVRVCALNRPKRAATDPALGNVKGGTELSDEALLR